MKYTRVIIVAVLPLLMNSCFWFSEKPDFKLEDLKEIEITKNSEYVDLEEKMLGSFLENINSSEEINFFISGENFIIFYSKTGYNDTIMFEDNMFSYKGGLFKAKNDLIEKYRAK
jgi:hypothetical protein